MNDINPILVCQNATVLANTVVLASGIISNLSDKNISKSLNGESLTRDRVEHLIATRLCSMLTESQ